MAQGNGKVQKQAVGRGVEFITGSDLNEGDAFTVLRFRNDGNTGPSASGKTTGVATTGGNTMMPNGIYVGVNAYRKP